MARDDWLESLLAEELNVTVLVNHFTPTVTLGHVFKNTKMLLLLHYVPDSFKVNNEHLPKKKWTFILKSLKGRQIMISALQEVFAPFPLPPPCTPFICGFS